MPKFYTNIDLNKNQLKNAAVHNVPDSPSIPSSPSVGQIYFDANSSSGTANRLRIRNIDNDTWLSIPYNGSIVNSDIASSANIDVTKLLTSGTNAVTISSIGAPTGTVSFNSQAITNVTTLSTSGDVTVGGDLNVTGAINETNVNNLNVKDLTITVAQGSANKTSSNTAGLTVDLGSDGTAKLYYTSTGDRFNFDKDVNLTSGQVYKINGTTVLSSSAVLGRTPGGNASGDIVTTDGSQTLTYKTLTSPTISTILNTGTLTLPTTTGTIALTSDITNGTANAVSHALSQGTGITTFSYDGSAAKTVAIDTSVVATYTTDTLTSSITKSSLTKIGALSSGTAGFVKVDASGNLTSDSNTYLTGNQTITLSGDVSGSGTTAITTTIGAGKVTNAMLAGSIDLTTKVTGQLPVANGGTGASTASAARSNLGVPGKYTTTFTASSGTVVKTITQATHGLASNRNLIVQVSDSSGNVVYADIAIGATGTVTITFTDASASYDTYDITIIG